jgi:lipid-binding SYLF domain-containing protein
LLNSSKDAWLENSANQERTLKMKILMGSLILLLAVAPAAFARGGGDRSEAVKRLSHAATVLGEIMDAPDKGIPQQLLDKAECVAIVPSLKRAGLGFGGKYGKGVVMCRQGGKDWSAPAFIVVEGGSFGLQLGFQESDVVMLIMNHSGMEKLLSDKFTLGGDASAAAGPVGRDVAAETDLQMNAEILTYSRSRGLFAGLTLNGAVVRPDKKDSREFYGKYVSAKEILGGNVPVPSEARPLVEALNRISPAKEK